MRDVARRLVGVVVRVPIVLAMRVVVMVLVRLASLGHSPRLASSFMPLFGKNLLQITRNNLPS